MSNIISTIKNFMHGGPAAVAPIAPTKVVAPVSKIDLSGLRQPGMNAGKAVPLPVVLAPVVIAPAVAAPAPAAPALTMTPEELDFDYESVQKAPGRQR